MIPIVITVQGEEFEAEVPRENLEKSVVLTGQLEFAELYDDAQEDPINLGVWNGSVRSVEFFLDLLECNFDQSGRPIGCDFDEETLAGLEDTEIIELLGLIHKFQLEYLYPNFGQKDSGWFFIALAEQFYEDWVYFDDLYQEVFGFKLPDEFLVIIGEAMMLSSFSEEILEEFLKTFRLNWNDFRVQSALEEDMWIFYPSYPEIYLNSTTVMGPKETEEEARFRARQTNRTLVERRVWVGLQDHHPEYEFGIPLKVKPFLSNLGSCVSFGLTPDARERIDQGAKVEISHRNTAIRFGFLDLAQIVLEELGDGAFNDSGSLSDALIDAVKLGRTAVVEYFLPLISVEILNRREDHGHTLVSAAVVYGRTEILEMLLRRGANPNKLYLYQRNLQSGVSPLDLAIWMNRVPEQELLMSNKFEPEPEPDLKRVRVERYNPSASWETPNRLEPTKFGCLRDIPGFLAKYSEAEVIEFQVKNLIDVPPEFGSLYKLETLVLSYNSIILLPPEIASSRSLSELEVEENRYDLWLPPPLNLDFGQI